ncbi:B9_domain-containing protein [Hexamita inflata]|uniref:B9 domain-containing protein 1 n=1 Tax=Hexamita inflata TaxID=28002 RepID=A0AA86QBD9_9EUKA|nr:B9 domain-containing protein [Hexamita inflata]
MFKDRFQVHITGTIKALHSQYPNANIQYQIIAQPPWKVLFGAASGITQTALRSSTQTFGHQQVFNQLFQTQFVKESRNPLGWPVMVFSVFTINSALVESLIGYGVVRIPLENGQSNMKIPLFRPILQSNKVGINPEFVNAAILATSVQRGHIQTKSEGSWIEVEVGVVVF